MASALIIRSFATSVLAGLIAGGVLAGLNLAIIQPYLSAISENIIDELAADGEYDEEEFDSKLSSIYLVQTGGALAMGLGAGALVGGVNAFGKRTKGVMDALLIAGIAWFVLYAMPVAKYPPSAAALFYDEAAAEYYPLYFGYLALSGLAALGIAVVFRKLEKNKLLGMAALYLVVVAVAYFVFPTYDQDSLFDQSLLNSWRTATSAVITAFWFATGAIAGLLWKYGSPKKS